MKKRDIYSQIIILTITFFICANFTGGANQTKKDEPEFVQLTEGQGIFAGKIYDDNNVIPVHELSFTGHSKIGGVRRESDDSITVLDFAKIRSFEVLKESHISPRYQDKEFILGKVVSNSGAVVDDLLVPRGIVICAIATQTDMEKAWYLKKIKKIVIEGDLRKARARAFNEKLNKDIEQEEKNEQESFFGKIKKGFNKASDAIAVK
jgi:hypothetical protein